MLNDTQRILMNVIIGVIAICGFFIYYGKANGWFKKGGLVYEWIVQKKNIIIKNKKDEGENKDENKNN